MEEILLGFEKDIETYLSIPESERNSTLRKGPDDEDVFLPELPVCLQDKTKEEVKDIYKNKIASILKDSTKLFSFTDGLVSSEADLFASAEKQVNAGYVPSKTKSLSEIIKADDYNRVAKVVCEALIKNSDAANIVTTYAYLDPSGKPFKFKKGDGEEKEDVILEKSSIAHPNGSLLGFRLKGLDYLADIKSGVFKGYISSDSLYYTNAYNLESIDKVRIIHNAGNCSAALFISPYTKIDNSTNNVLSKLNYSIPTGTVYIRISGCLSDENIEIPFHGDGAPQAANSKIINYASKILSPEELAIALKGIATYNAKGLNATIYITDDQTDAQAVGKVKETFSKATDQQTLLWVNIRADKSIELKDFKTGSKAIIDKNGNNISASVNELLHLFTRAFPKLTFNPFTAMLDGLGGLIKELKLPEKYWNAGLSDYDNTFFTIYNLLKPDASAFAQLPAGSFSVGQLEFAGVCGFYDELIGLVASLPEGAGFIIKLITNEDNTRSNLIKVFGGIQSYCGKNNFEVYIAIPGVQLYGYSKCAWQMILGHFTTGNSCEIAHKSGGAVLQVATIALSFAKARVLAEIAEALELLDPLNLTLKGVFQIANPLFKGGKYLYKAGSKYITFVIENGKYVIKLADEAGNIINGIDFKNALHWAKLTDEAGNVYNVGLYLDDSQFKAALKKIESAKTKLKLAKDNHLKAIKVDNYGLAKIPGAGENGETLIGVVDDGVTKVNKTIVDNAFDKFGKLKPDVRYKTGEYEYFGETDNLGRLEKFDTENLQLTKRTERLPHDGSTPGKIEGDHAGHIFGDRFGGSPELDNLVSQASNANLSKFKVLENQWAKAIGAGKTVQVDIKINYNGSELRPSSFDVKYIIDGKLVKINIPNN